MNEFGNNENFDNNVNYDNNPDYNNNTGYENDGFNADVNYENAPEYDGNINYDNNIDYNSNLNYDGTYGYDNSFNGGYDANTGYDMNADYDNLAASIGDDYNYNEGTFTGNMQSDYLDENFAQSTDSALKSINAELTPAEIEDLRREKAAKRRKRMLREKRRKERQRQAIIRCSILIAAVILVIFLFVKIIAGIGGLIKNAQKNHKKSTEAVTTEATTTEEPVAVIDEAIVAKDVPETREAALEILKAQAETNSDINNIVENAAVYPDIVLKHLAVNSELIEFTLFYPAQINIPFDGDFTIENESSEIPLLLEYDSQWGYADYGSTVLGLNGDAPTALAMAYLYLTGDGTKNPIIIGDLSMEKGYLNENDETDPKLMTEGAAELGLESTELDLNKDSIISALSEGNAVICAMQPGDFTRTKSYIVIKDYKNGLFYVNDPSSEARSTVGWDYKRLSSQISGMWSLKRGTAPVSTGEDNDTNTEGNADTTNSAGNNDANADGTNSTDTNNTDNTDNGTTGNTDSNNSATDTNTNTDGGANNSNTDNGGN